ncbi:hypothetical protein BASA81_013640 [Batrachochytrium salamandrivorans]|nr:hypothetical protein BASA81_013640 [Batrachochytrium salamandrivorans]
MASLEEILSSLSARLRLLENENESLKVDIQESRAIANRAILEHTITGNAHMSILEPKASLPDKFDGTRKNFRGFINQLELVFQLQASRYDTDRKKIAMLGTLLNGNALSWYNPYLEKTGSLPVRSLDLAKVQGQIPRYLWRNQSGTSLRVQAPCIKTRKSALVRSMLPNFVN